MVVKACVDIVWEVVRENGSNGRDGVVWKGKASLCRGGRGGVFEGSFSAENRDISRSWSRGGHRGSEVFASRGSDEDVVGVNSDIFVERGKEERIKDLLSDLGRSGRHSEWRRNN